MNAGAVVNPASGDGAGERLAREFADRVDGADLRVSTGPDDVSRVARELADRDLLAVVGGDGTVREVVDAVGDDAPPLFVVPAGRGNSTYRHCYGAVDWRHLADGIADGMTTRPLDAGRVESAAFEGGFVLGYTAGLFRAAVGAAETFDALPGVVAYVLGTARAVFAAEPTRVTVDADGEQVFDGRARLVAVGGGRYRGNAFELCPDSRPADGSLHLVVIEPTGLRGAVRVTRAALDGQHVHHPAVHYRRASTVRLSSPEGFPAEVDGTPLDACVEATVECLPGVLSLAYPEAVYR
jgi:diacylglycerol kinase (ATP)